MKSNNRLSSRIAMAAVFAALAIYARPLNAAPSPTPHAHASNMPGMTSPAPSSSPMPSMGDDKMMMGKMDAMMKSMEQMMPMMEKMHQMMPMMTKMEKMMPMMEKMMGAMPSASTAMSPMATAPPMTSMGDDSMEMSGMMGMAPMGNNMSSSALPGFPGASHLYHIGATGFFLDHPRHITLTTDQQVALNKIKDQAFQAKSAAERNIEQAEQELGTLTAADQPDGAKIEAKVRDIAKIAADQRVAFIRAVGEAAKILTADQRKSLTGFAPPAPAMPMTPSAPSPSPMKMDHM